MEEKKTNTKALKAIIITIASLITLGCVVFGIMRFIKGGFKGFKSKNDSYYVEADDADAFPLNDSITSVEVDMAMGDLIIRHGSTPSISIEGAGNTMPTYTLEDGVLKVKQKGSSSFSLFGNGGLSAEVIITLSDPLEDLDVNLNMGELEIKNISTQNADIVLNMGDCSVNSVIFGSCDCTLNMGAADFKDVDFEALDLTCDMGSADIDVTKDLDEYSVDARASLGSISVGGSQYSSNYKTTTGQSSLEVNCSMGSITIK